MESKEVHKKFSEFPGFSLDHKYNSGMFTKYYILGTGLNTYM